MHLILGHPIEQINKFILNLSYRGIARLKQHCVKQAEAVTPHILIQIGFVLNLSDKSDIVFWCLFLFAFFLLARKSNLVPASKK